MEKIKVIVHGVGNIGRELIAAVEATDDFECVGVVRRKESIGKNPNDLRGVDEFSSIDELIKKKSKPQLALIGTPSRNALADDTLYLSRGISTVDSFDIHTEIVNQVKKLEVIAKKNNAVAITASGWDPGSDSVLRALFEAMVPRGTTFTNFGRGMSMGHSAAARAIKGVEDAISITIPIGGGRHSRLVYLLIAKGAKFAEVAKRLQKDDYFSHDPLDVREVKSKKELALVCDSSHGVLMERTGASGLTPNQILKFDMRINNPALTAQIMLSSGRAALKMQPGSYTLIDIPPVYYLQGERLDAIKRLV